MPKGFIQCTVANKERRKCYFHAAHISAVLPQYTNGKFSYTIVYFGTAHDDCSFCVYETPEDIMRMIEEATA